MKTFLSLMAFVTNPGIAKEMAGDQNISEAVFDAFEVDEDTRKEVIRTVRLVAKAGW